jgi:hypothetical protein
MSIDVAWHWMEPVPSGAGAHRSEDASGDESSNRYTRPRRGLLDRGDPHADTGCRFDEKCRNDAAMEEQAGRSSSIPTSVRPPTPQYRPMTLRIFRRPGFHFLPAR